MSDHARMPCSLVNGSCRVFQTPLPSQIPKGYAETQVRSLGGEDPLKKEMATHSSILVWEIPWTEEPGGLQPMEL